MEDGDASAFERMVWTVTISISAQAGRCSALCSLEPTGMTHGHRSRKKAPERLDPV